MSASNRGWLVFRADLTPNWDAFHAYWYGMRAKAERKSRQAGHEAFEAQLAAASVLIEASWAARRHVEAVRKAEIRAERHAASIERRRRYNAAWMRDYRARKSRQRGREGAPRAS
jgi:hypothetical protein